MVGDRGVMNAFPSIEFADNHGTKRKDAPQSNASNQGGGSRKGSKNSLNLGCVTDKTADLGQVLARQHRSIPPECQDDDDDFGVLVDNLGDDIAADPLLQVQNLEEALMQVQVPATQPTYAIRDDFRDYCRYRCRYSAPFSRDWRNAIELLDRLRRTKASLDTYESIMLWHFRASGKIRPHHTLSSCRHYVSRKVIFKHLRKRYNMLEENFSKVKTITLPFSQAKVNMVLNDAEHVLQNMLTDPRIRKKDYLFFNDDPFAPPPEDLDYIKDLNTGLAYTETYKKLITKPGKQILLPIIMYADAANTGQMSNLPITAVRIALGILNRKARDRDELWGTLGYIPVVRNAKNKGKQQLFASGHADAQMAHRSSLQAGVEDASIEADDEEDEDAVKAQDLHRMFEVILESYVKIQDKGFIFDFFYNGKLYKDVEFVLFTPFLKLDTDEADKITGKYSVRSGKVKHLCRYCHCPTEESDDPRADYPPKLRAEIEALYEDGDTEGLQLISQQYIKNAFYKIRFGMHNEAGVHGACPLEMLHHVLLGIFKYVRDCWFEQIGKVESSKLAGRVNSLAQEFGSLLARQSDEDLPRTSLTEGAGAGKIMAKEYTGVLLVMAAVMRSALGQELLQKKTRWRNRALMKDWIVLVETMLQWEQWLKSPKMKKNHVEAAKNKHRYIMYLLKKIGNRVEGMGLKLMKFHGILHMYADILINGVPMEVDTGSNESGHKKSKIAALVTQLNEAVFELQTSLRKEEVELIKLALEEMKGRPLWNYPIGHPITHEDEESSCDGSENDDEDGLFCEDDESLTSVSFQSMEEMSESSSDSGGYSDDGWGDSDEASLCSEQEASNEGAPTEEFFDLEPEIMVDSDFHSANMEPPVANGPVLLVDPPEKDQRKIGGAKFACYWAENGTAAFLCKTRMKGKGRVKLEDDLVRFVIDLQETFEEFYPDGVLLRTLHKRDGIKFRGNVSHIGAVWRDWVMVRWEIKEEPKPCRIWGYVDLRSLPADYDVSFGGLACVQPGLYAIVENSTIRTDKYEVGLSSIFSPIRTKIKRWEGPMVKERQFYLADVEAFEAPVAVIPNIGGKANEYFIVKNRTEWKEDFVEWLEEPIELDEINEKGDNFLHWLENPEEYDH
jgi:hypothetical protein